MKTQNTDFFSVRYPTRAPPTPRIDWGQFCGQRPITLVDTIVPDPQEIEPMEDDPDEDDLRPARGIALGTLSSILLWVVAIGVVVAAVILVKRGWLS
jgi:hypothetical protein